MALKAGRRGLNKRLVDAFGNFNGEMPVGEYYTKTQTDHKFETKTHVNNTFQKKTLELPLETLMGSKLTVEDSLDALNEIQKTRQPKTLELPIEMLSGSKLTVEDALQGLNEEKFTYADNGVLGAKNLYSLSSTHTFVKSTARTFESNKLDFTQGDTINVSFDISDVANFGGTTGISVKFIDDSNNDVSEFYDYGLIDGHYKHTFTINAIPTGQVRALMFLMSTEPNDNATLKLSNIMCYLGTDPDDTYVPYAMTNREITEELTVQESAVTDIISGTVGDMGNHLYKYGKVVHFVLRLNNTTLPEWGETPIFIIPQGYRPKSTIRCLDYFDTSRNININTNGTVFCSKAITDGMVTFSATWITD